MVYTRADGSKYILRHVPESKSKVRLDLEGPAPWSVRILVEEDEW